MVKPLACIIEMRMSECKDKPAHDRFEIHSQQNILVSQESQEMIPEHRASS